MSNPSVTVISLVVQNPLTKLEALELIARASGCAIVGAGTASAAVQLGPEARAHVEVPKFGEDVQLAIDVTAPDERWALTLLEQLRGLGLDVSVLGS
ncbi:MAG TPA: hypothetical protein VK139_03220 [Microbacteriaceae bacterium]|nr:hypothetical protein [Microbacteriaceae bacterium]